MISVVTAIWRLVWGGFSVFIFKRISTCLTVRRISLISGDGGISLLVAGLEDYIYIPLGGNRVSRWRWLKNLLIVWLLTGLWHGASFNFILWGLYFACLLIIEKVGGLSLMKRLPIGIAWGMTFF